MLKSKTFHLFALSFFFSLHSKNQKQCVVVVVFKLRSLSADLIRSQSDTPFHYISL